MFPVSLREQQRGSSISHGSRRDPWAGRVMESAAGDFPDLFPAPTLSVEFAAKG